jgi:phage tail-like protein
VTLTRGLTGDNSFEKWIKDSQFGKVSNARKGSAIIVFDVEGTAVKRYNLINARLKTSRGEASRRVTPASSRRS